MKRVALVASMALGGTAAVLMPTGAFASPASAIAAPHPTLGAPSTSSAATEQLVTLAHDPETHVVEFRACGGATGQEYFIHHRPPAGDVDDAKNVSYESDTKWVPAGEVWHYGYDRAYKGDRITYSTSPKGEEHTLTITNGQPAPAPTATSVKNPDGTVTIAYTHYRWGTANLRNADDVVVAGAPTQAYLPDGSIVAKMTIPDPGRSARFQASSERTSPILEAADLTVNEGVTQLTPAAPVVDEIQSMAGKIAATVQGEAGAVVRVKDVSNRTVAVKAVGESGSIRIVIPAHGTSELAEFQVTQTAGGATSAATSLTT